MSANITILGNIGKDPMTKVNDNGTMMTTFSIAHNIVRNTPEGKLSKPDWYRITAFGKQAENLARYARKGNLLLVQGKLSLNPWLGNDGQPQVSADVYLQDFSFVSDGRRGEGGSGEADTNGGNETASQVPAMTGPVQETAQVDAF